MYTDMDRTSAMTKPAKTPKRSVYKAAEVCALTKLQPYVLRSWEAEFLDLGMLPEGSRSRVYRQVDVNKILRIKELLFVDGLTLGAARRKILKEVPAEDQAEQPSLAELLDADVRARVEDVKTGLRSILAMLSDAGNGDGGKAAEASLDSDDASAGPTSSPHSRKTTRVRRAAKTSGKLRRKRA